MTFMHEKDVDFNILDKLVHSFLIAIYFLVIKEVYGDLVIK